MISTWIRSRGLCQPSSLPHHCQAFRLDKHRTGVRVRAAFAILPFTGCRVSELSRLRYGSCEQNGVLRVLEIHGKAGKSAAGSASPGSGQTHRRFSRNHRPVVNRTSHPDGTGIPAQLLKPRAPLALHAPSSPKRSTLSRPTKKSSRTKSLSRFGLGWRIDQRAVLRRSIGAAHPGELKPNFV